MRPRDLFGFPIRRRYARDVRTTLTIDDDVLDWFREQVHTAGGGSYQTMMNDALREFIDAGYEPIEDRVRQVVREELAAYDAGKEDG